MQELFKPWPALVLTNLPESLSLPVLEVYGLMEPPYG